MAQKLNPGPFLFTKNVVQSLKYFENEIFETFCVAKLSEYFKIRIQSFTDSSFTEDSLNNTVRYAIYRICYIRYIRYKNYVAIISLVTASNNRSKRRLKERMKEHFTARTKGS